MRAWALQVAIVGILRAHDPLMTIAVGGVHDHVRDDKSTFPYVVVGEGTATRDDTDDMVGAEHTVEIHAWSRYRGRRQVKEMQQEIYAALHRASMSVSDAIYIDCNLEFEETFLDPDGITRHGVQRFRVLLEEVM